MKKYQSNVNMEQLIGLEVKRLSELFGKSFLDCDDIVKITGLGRDNVRAMMDGYHFPVTKIGKRKVVSILAFLTWQMAQ